MKDLTIAQAQANVERKLRAEKRKGKRQRMPKPNAMQGMVVAEARRLEENLARKALDDGWPSDRWATRPEPMRNMAEVNRRISEMKRRVLMIERDAVELTMQVRRLLMAAQGNPTDLGDGKDA